MRWSVLIDADLSKLGGPVRTNIIDRAMKNFDCIASWRKDRHSENDMSIPYRVSVRGVEAEVCMEWLLDVLCTEHSDQLDIEDIWATPMPDESQQAKVQQCLEGVIVMVFDEESGQRLQDRPQNTVILRPPPDVQRQKTPGLVKSRLQDARKLREEQKAGLTAQPVAKSPSPPKEEEPPVEVAKSPSPPKEEEPPVKEDLKEEEPLVPVKESSFIRIVTKRF